jgi:hypothetical protein
MSYVGYEPLKATGITLSPGEIKLLDFDLEITAVELSSYEVIDYKVPLLERDRTGKGQRASSQEKAKLPAYEGIIQAQ